MPHVPGHPPDSNWLANALSWQVPGSQNLPRYQGRNIPGIGGYLDAAAGMLVPGVETQRMAEQGAGPWSLAGSMAMDALPVGMLGGGLANLGRKVFPGAGNLGRGFTNMWSRFNPIPGAGSTMEGGVRFPNQSMMGPYMEGSRPTVMTRDAAGNMMPFYQSRGQSGKMPYNVTFGRLTGQGVDPGIASQIASDVSGQGQWVPSQGFAGRSPMGVEPVKQYNPLGSGLPDTALSDFRKNIGMTDRPSWMGGQVGWQEPYQAVTQAMGGVDPATAMMSKFGNDPNLLKLSQNIGKTVGREFNAPVNTGATNRMLGITPPITPIQMGSRATSPGAMGSAASVIGGAGVRMPTQDEGKGRAQYLAGQNRRRGGL